MGGKERVEDELAGCVSSISLARSERGIGISVGSTAAATSDSLSLTLLASLEYAGTSELAAKKKLVKATTPIRNADFKDFSRSIMP